VYGAFCETPLHLAARFGREDLAGPLIAAAADVEAQNELGERPLHLSANYGHPTVAKLLVARGAAVGARDRGGKTPLHAAAFGVGDQSKLDAHRSRQTAPCRGSRRERARTGQRFHSASIRDVI
jgi:ankyrin repeat protein